MTDPELAAQEIMLLLSKAEGLFAQRDISAARLMLRRAAKAGNARAALRLGGDIRGMFALPIALQRGRRPCHSANLV
jgi:TPR repeat protein